MSRSVYEVENILLSVLRPVYKTDGLSLYCNSPLSFQIHIIKHLILHFPFGEQSRRLYEPVGKGAFSVVDMSHYTKIPDSFLSVYGHFYPPDKILKIYIKFFRYSHQSTPSDVAGRGKHTHFDY